jgi:hypothetical protein
LEYASLQSLFESLVNYHCRVLDEDIELSEEEFNLWQKSGKSLDEWDGNRALKSALGEDLLSDEDALENLALQDYIMRGEAYGLQVYGLISGGIK